MALEWGRASHLIDAPVLGGGRSQLVRWLPSVRPDVGGSPAK